MYYFYFWGWHSGTGWGWSAPPCSTSTASRCSAKTCPTYLLVSQFSNISSSVLQVKHVFNIQPVSSCSTGQTWSICNNSKPLGAVRKPQGDHRHPRSYQSWLRRGGQWTEGQKRAGSLVRAAGETGEADPVHDRTTPRPENFEQDGKKIQPAVFLSLTFVLKVFITFCQVFILFCTRHYHEHQFKNSNQIKGKA